MLTFLFYFTIINIFKLLTQIHFHYQSILTTYLFLLYNLIIFYFIFIFIFKKIQFASEININF
jgi:hypothetical protein